MTSTPTTIQGTHASLGWAYEYCRQITRHHAKSFYFCAQFLPAAKRQAIYAIYSLCRHLDDFVDAAGDRSALDIRALLDEWRQHLRQPGTSTHPALAAWADTSSRYGIDAGLAEELMQGVLMDLAQTRYETYEELSVYCYRVASVVGLMTSEVFGYGDASALDRAVDLGHAMQLTNICRDVGEDARMGRIYLPREDLARFGVSEAGLLAGRREPGFEELMRFQISRARGLYHQAEPGIDLLSRDCQYTVRLSSRVYSQILDRIERNGYDVLERRAYVPFGSKIASVPAVWFESRFGTRRRGRLSRNT